MNRTSLLHLVNNLEPSATRTLVLGLANELDKEKYKVHVGAVNHLNGWPGEQLVPSGVQITNFAAGGCSTLCLVRRLVAYIKANNIEIVHTHILRPDLLGGLAARLARRPLLFSTKHNMAYVRGQKGWLFRNLFYWPAMYLPDQVITVTDLLRREVVSRLNLASDRVITIHNGISIEDFYRPASRDPVRQSLGIASEEFVVSYVGRLVEGKGLEDLLQAATQVLAKHQRSRFLFVGQGALGVSLKRLAEKLNIVSEVMFTGFRDDIPQILAGSDVLVLPSLSEGLPLCLLEGMAAGKAIVATQVGGIVELLESSVTGLTVPAQHPQALAEAIISLLENQNEREEMGRRAREYVGRHNGISHMVSAYDSTYQRNLAKKRLAIS